MASFGGAKESAGVNKKPANLINSDVIIKGGVELNPRNTNLLKKRLAKALNKNMVIVKPNATITVISTQEEGKSGDTKARIVMIEDEQGMAHHYKKKGQIYVELELPELIEKELKKIIDLIDPIDKYIFEDFETKLKKHIKEVKDKPNRDELIRDVVAVMERNVDYQIESLETELSAIETLNYEREKSTIEFEIKFNQSLKNELQNFFNMFRNEDYPSAFKPAKNDSNTPYRTDGRDVTTHESRESHNYKGTEFKGP